MTLHPLKYNLFLADFSVVEVEINSLLKKELDVYGVITYDSLPKKDYRLLLSYFTLKTVCVTYNSFTSKKNTVFWVNIKKCNPDILTILKEIKKCFPVLFYFTSKSYTDTVNSKDTAEYLEVSMEICEFRYSVDYSKFSFNKIKRFCLKNGLSSLLESFKL